MNAFRHWLKTFWHLDDVDRHELQTILGQVFVFEAVFQLPAQVIKEGNGDSPSEVTLPLYLLGGSPGGFDDQQFLAF